jgi:cytochrome c biogenesis protein CcmG/thiol:disulfide interchange protein DsbE
VLSERVGVLLLVFGLLAGCASGPDASGPDASGSGAAGPPPASNAGVRSQLPACPQPGSPAGGDSVLPDLTLPCLGRGPAVALRRLTGTPTVVNLWASWCVPCRQELPVFDSLRTAAGGRIGVLGVATEDPPGRAASFAADIGTRFPSVVDDTGRLLRALGRKVMPTTVFVDARGTVVEVYTDVPFTADSLRRRVRERLGVDVG